jgi:hypothetical protein
MIAKVMILGSHFNALSMVQIFGVKGVINRSTPCFTVLFR